MTRGHRQSETVKMLRTVFVAFLVLFATAASAQAPACCDDVKSYLEKKSSAHKILCPKLPKAFSDCCKEIRKEIESELLAFETICPTSGGCTNPQALGIESSKIPDAAMSASSIYNPTYQPYYGRLNVSRGSCSWTPSGGHQAGSWLQVDFGVMKNVTAVATQGGCISREWTKTYVISYSKNCVKWTYYLERATKKAFVGNTDQNTIVTNYFHPPFSARYVRIYPQSWNSYASMRIEYYGCRLEN